MLHHQKQGDKQVTVAVAINNGKTSKAAFKWTVENVISKSQPITLIHVRSNPGVDERLTGTAQGSDSQKSIKVVKPQQLDIDSNDMFREFLLYCKRKNVQCHTVVLDASSQTDIPRALIEFVKITVVDILVVGSPGKSGFLRQLNGPEIASIVTRSAPTFCSIHVVAKGKLSYSRMSTSPVPVKPLNSLQPLHAHLVYKKCASGNPPEKEVWMPALQVPKVNEAGDIIRSPFPRKGASRYKPDKRLDIPFVNHSKPEKLLLGTLRRQFSGKSDDSFSSSSGGSMASLSSLSSWSSSSQSTDELESEMRRLMLELKHTKEMYTAAIKEAKQGELRDRIFKQQRLQRTKQAEEVALALAEKETERYKTALEAAKASKRLAEIEAQKRTEIEMRGLREERQRSLAKGQSFKCRKYSYEDIEQATQHFSEGNKIGEGGYGPVYKGFLDHTPVAVKVLRSKEAEGQCQFQKEVEVLSCIRHPNMVLLLGACPEQGALVYEYMENGSLEDRLFRQGNTFILSWKQRFRIAADIATGLLFLHSAKPEPLVHRDLKPGNILLTRNYVAKISDVGLARLLPPSVANQVTQYKMTHAAGTFCYIDPEYQQTCMVSTKSDVYSLGVMLLQIITARPAMGLAHQVEQSIENGTFSTILDPNVPDWPVDAALRFAETALKCAELRRKDRPDLGQVLPVLHKLGELRERDMCE